jgi:hypothetical protein
MCDANFISKFLFADAKTHLRSMLLRQLRRFCMATCGMPASSYASPTTTKPARA